MRLEDRLDRFFLRRIDERARVHHQHVGVVSIRGYLHSALQNAAEHDLGIDQIFRAAETDHADFRRRCRIRNHRFIAGGLSRSDSNAEMA